MIMEVTTAWDDAWITSTHAVVVAVDDVQFCRAHAYGMDDPEVGHPVSPGTYVKLAAKRAGGPRLVMRATAAFDVVGLVGAEMVAALAGGRGPDQAISAVARALAARGRAEAVGIVDGVEGEYHPLEATVEGIESFMAEMDRSLALRGA